MRVWGHTIWNVLEAGKDAGWVVAVVLICIGTFAVSSVFIKRGTKISVSEKSDVLGSLKAN